MRVVIAEDSGLVRQGLVRLLEEEGFDVIAAVDNPDDLVRRVAFDTPDVAIVDIRMPPTQTNEGILAAEKIRAEHPDTGVLVLSQHVETALCVAPPPGRGGAGWVSAERPRARRRRAVRRGCPHRLRRIGHRSWPGRTADV